MQAPKRPLKRPTATRYKLTPVTSAKCQRSSDGDTYPSRQLKANEIRLLELRPGRYGQPVHCNVNIFQLAASLRGVNPDWPESCDFEALSYTWGPSLEGHTIRLNGCLDLLVTDNLWHALQRLRWTYYPRYLWIDAIVINQNDDFEKSQQVLKMMTIYACAKRTLVWLGEPTRPPLPERKHQLHTPEFMRQQYEIAPRRCAAPRGYQNGYYPPALERYTVGLPFHVRDIFSRRRDVTTFKNLEAALASTSAHWYTRMWIVQEFAVSRSIQFLFGNVSVDPEVFDPDTNPYAKEIIRKMHTASPFTTKLQGNLRSLKDIASVHSKIERSENFMNLIYRLSSFEVTNPRDRVYSLLGLINGQHASMFDVDYTRATGLVFAQATFVDTRVMRNLNILTQIRFNRTADLDFPSWAFDFRVKDGAVPFPMYSLRHQSDERPREGQDLAKLDESWRYLTVRGRLLDRILLSEDLREMEPTKAAVELREGDAGSMYKESELDNDSQHSSEDVDQATDTTPTCISTGSRRGYLNGKYSHLASLAGNDPLYRGGNESSVYARAGCANPSARFGLRFPECDLALPQHQKSLARIDEVLLACIVRATSSPPPRSPMQTEILQTLYAYAVTASGGASVFTTNTLFLAGFGPAGIRNGDSIVLMRGCRLPMVLRPGETQGTWVFRGFAYVRGVVDYEYYSRQLKQRGEVAKKDPEMRFAIYPKCLRAEEEDVEFVLA